MKRSPRPRETAKLSESLNKRLNAYALAASAAGVSALALTSPAEAKIIYTPTHHVIRVGGRYNIELYHNGVVDFVLLNSSRKSSTTFPPGGALLIQPAIGNGVAPGKSCLESCNLVTARAYRNGSAIDYSGSGRGGAIIFKYFTRYYGAWYPNKKDLYVGLVFYIGEESHYGWARISVSGNGHHRKYETVGTLTGYAFETVPKRPIIAGKTKGPDVITLEPGTLGRLALGKK